MSKKTTNFGFYLKKYLESGAIQVKTLADITGLSIYAIYLIRDGKTDPKESTMRSIATALGYSISEFLADGPNHAHDLNDCLEAVTKAVKKCQK